jgi:hypothetical protein
VVAFQESLRPNNPPTGGWLYPYGVGFPQTPGFRGFPLPRWRVSWQAQSKTLEEARKGLAQLDMGRAKNVTVHGEGKLLHYCI